MIAIGIEQLTALAPVFSGEKARAQAAILSAIGPVFSETLDRYGIDSELRVAHFLAQIAHESAGFRTTEEFASGEAYEGRADLGNTQAGDGKRFKGRGLIQLTGRENYKKLGDKLGRDFIAAPQTCAEPELSLIIACEYWDSRDINTLADGDDIEAVTRAVNGGLNGLEDRQRYLDKAKAILAGDTSVEPRTVLHKGDHGIAVLQLQIALREAGYELSADGDFGPGTQGIVKQYQSDNGLAADGIAGPQTLAKLGLQGF